MAGRHPLSGRQTHPPGRQTTPGRQKPRSRQKPPGRETPSRQADTPLTGRHPPAGRHPSNRQTPPGTATAVDATHPTGMHSCFHAVFFGKNLQSNRLAHPLWELAPLRKTLDPPLQVLVEIKFQVWDQVCCCLTGDTACDKTELCRPGCFLKISWN